jgi:hydrogenase maturation protease
MTDDWLIIGYGNTLRGDDAAGVVAAERLDRRLDVPGVRVVACQQLTPELAADLCTAREAIFVDASVKVPPGTLELEHLDDRAVPPAGLHGCGAAELLAMTRAMYGRAPQASLWHIGVADLSLREGLSRPVAGAVERVVDRVVAQVTELTHA